MEKTQTDSSFRRNLIIIGCCWAAIFTFVLGGIVGATLSPPATPTPTTTTTSPICPRQWVSGVGWVAIVHSECNIYSAATSVDSQMPLPSTCKGIDMVTQSPVPAGCDGMFSSQAFTTTGNTGSTAITPPAPVSTPAQCQAQHDYYTPQGCIGSEGVGSTTNITGDTTAITPPMTPRMYPPPPKGKCVKTATTWTCTPTRPVTG